MNPLPPPIPSQMRASASLQYATGYSDVSFLPRWAGVVAGVYALTRVSNFFIIKAYNSTMRNGRVSTGYTSFWQGSLAAFDYVLVIAAMLLVVASVGCFLKGNWGRFLAFVCLAAIAITDLLSAVISNWRYSTSEMGMPRVQLAFALAMVTALRNTLLPLCLAWLLTRSQVKETFR